MRRAKRPLLDALFVIGVAQTAAALALGAVAVVCACLEGRA